METLEQVVRSLDRFKTPDELAEFLLSEGCKGKINNHHCPISRYLQKTIPKSWVGFECAHSETESLIKLSLPAKEFVSRFDNKKYPELLEV